MCLDAPTPANTNPTPIEIAREAAAAGTQAAAEWIASAAGPQLPGVDVDMGSAPGSVYSLSTRAMVHVQGAIAQEVAAQRQADREAYEA